MSNFKMTDEQFAKLSAMKIDQPPAWCKGSIATNAGWINPRTREVVFASAGLARRIQEFLDEKARREAATTTALEQQNEPKQPELKVSKVPVVVVDEPKKEIVVEPIVEKVAVATDEPVRWVGDKDITYVAYVDSPDIEPEQIEVKKETSQKAKPKRKGGK